MPDDHSAMLMTLLCRVNLAQAPCLVAAQAFSLGQLTTLTQSPGLISLRVLLGGGEAEEQPKMAQLQKAKLEMVCLHAINYACSIRHPC